MKQALGVGVALIVVACSSSESTVGVDSGVPLATEDAAVVVEAGTEQDTSTTTVTDASVPPVDAAPQPDGCDVGKTCDEILASDNLLCGHTYNGCGYSECSRECVNGECIRAPGDGHDHCTCGRSSNAQETADTCGPAKGRPQYLVLCTGTTPTSPACVEVVANSIYCCPT